METVTVNIDNNMIALIENLVENEIFPNKSECIRAATRNLLLFHRKLKINSKINPNVLVVKTFKKEKFYDIENRIITNNQISQESEIIN